MSHRETVLLLGLSGGLGFTVGRLARPAASALAEPAPPGSPQARTMVEHTLVEHTADCVDPPSSGELRAEVEQLELRLLQLRARTAAEEGRVQPWSAVELATLEEQEAALVAALDRAGLVLEELDCSEKPCMAWVSGALDPDEHSIELDGFLGQPCVQAVSPEPWAVAAFYPQDGPPAADFERARRVQWRCRGLVP